MQEATIVDQPSATLAAQHGGSRRGLPRGRRGCLGEGTSDLGIPLNHVFTDAQGRFQLPMLPGGRYAVGFVPPAGSPYSGVFAVADAHHASDTHPWWVVLPRLTAP